MIIKTKMEIFNEDDVLSLFLCRTLKILDKFSGFHQKVTKQSNPDLMNCFEQKKITYSTARVFFSTII